MDVVLAGPLPPPISGPELVTETLLSMGSRVDIHYVHLNLSARSNVSRGRWSLDGIVRALGQGIHFTWVAWKWRGRAKIVHLPLAQSNSGVLRDLVLFRVAKFFGYKVLVQFHGGDFERFWERCRYRGFVARTLARVDTLLVFDARIKSQFPFVSAKRVAVFPNPVPVGWTRDFLALPIRQTAHQPLRILFVSHISVAKGFLDLVEALVRLPKSYAWELHVAGDRIDVERNIVWTGTNMDDGWMRAAEVLKARGLMDRMIYHGVVSADAKQALFRTGHVLVLPSYSEGLPIVILEAMYAGLAVISTKVGAIPSLLPPSVLVNPGDIRTLSTLMAKLDPILCEEWGKTNRERMEQGYLPHQVLEKLRSLYESMDSRHPPINWAERIPRRESH